MKKNKINKRIENLINYLGIEKRKGYYEIKNNWISKPELKKNIREIIGINKQCMSCGEFKMYEELRPIEGRDDMICDGCAELILSGKKKI